MPQISPIPAITPGTPAPDSLGAGAHGDLSPRIAPPYDVLDEAGKAKLLARDAHNIVAIDLPHLPAKTVGPDPTYAKAGEVYRQWLDEGVLARRQRPAIFVYQQTFTVAGKSHVRRGLIANLPVQKFGKAPTSGGGGIHPHEQTFSGPKEDRLKLMRATRCQLSPIFGLYSDTEKWIEVLLAKAIHAGPPTLRGTTLTDGVLHEAWAVEDPQSIAAFNAALGDKDVYIADGHHRYTTALNYQEELRARGSATPASGQCMFVLIALQDPGMIVLPTHRVLGGMSGFTLPRFIEQARGELDIKTFSGTLEELEAALPRAGPHAMGLFVPLAGAAATLAIATTVDPDPLRKSHGQQSEAWRQLDVAIVQHVIVERICQPNFCTPPGSPGSNSQTIAWKFPHTLDQLRIDADGKGYQLGIIVQPTPLESVIKVSQAGELMPQKSTFFYPKLATGLVLNPLE